MKHPVAGLCTDDAQYFYRIDPFAKARHQKPKRHDDERYRPHHSQSPKRHGREVSLQDRRFAHRETMAFQTASHLSDIRRVGFRECLPIGGKFVGREEVHADISFDVGNIEPRSRFLLSQLDQLIFRHGIEAYHLVVRPIRHI